MAGLSKLEAVNIMLRNIGEAPVASLVGASGDIYVSQAQATLEELTREVQTEDWRFNKDYQYPLAPDGSGYITVTDSMVSVDASDISVQTVMRQGKLYNQDDQTFVWDDSLKCDIQWEFTFEETPQYMRRYIAIRSARVFASRQLGDIVGEQLTEDDEARARATAKRRDKRVGDRTVFENQFNGVGRLRNRRIR